MTATDATPPWHEGEARIHERLHIKTRMAHTGAETILDRLPVAHQRFLAMLPYLVIGTADAAGRAWASVVVGKSGFAQALSPLVVRVTAERIEGDPAWDGIAPDQAIGMLGISLAYQRRIRINGRVGRVSADAFEVQVAQSYENCPQYIRKRVAGLASARRIATGITAGITVGISADAPNTVHRTATIDERAARFIAAADTGFIASYADVGGQRQMDVSHRGGQPGFVRVGADGVLTLPDFAGNRYFNTLGNILVNPRCGLTFLDFHNGDMLQLTGDAEVIFDSPEIASFPGAERLVRITPEQVVFRPGACRLRWRSLTSQTTPITPRASGDAGPVWRTFQVSETVDETARVRSVYFTPTDGLGLTPHQAGQSVAVRIKLPSGVEQVSRHALLSLASDPDGRIAIHRGDPASDDFYALQPGDALELGQLGGDFVLSAAPPKLTVLVAAGIGIAPMLGLLRQILEDAFSARFLRPTWLVYAARTVEQRAFDLELIELVRASKGLIEFTRILSDATSAQPQDYEQIGHIDLDLFRAALSPENYRLDSDVAFYLNTPPLLTRQLCEGLRALGVPRQNLHVA